MFFNIIINMKLTSPSNNKVLQRIDIIPKFFYDD